MANGDRSVFAVYERLREAILYGELEAGMAIPQQALSERFDAGRTPLREALRMLQREGLVVAPPNRAVRVAALSPDAFEELYVRRLALEAIAIRITVPMLSTDDLAELEAAMTRMDHYHEYGDPIALRVPHRAFHEGLVAGAGPDVTQEICTLADHSERYRLSFGAYGSFEDRRAEHRRVLYAAKTGDPELAANRLGEHYAHTAALVFTALAPGRTPARLRVVLGTVAPGAVGALDDCGPRLIEDDQK
jgi:DNA-binding GntR family transcriptional regulator